MKSLNIILMVTLCLIAVSSIYSAVFTVKNRSNQPLEVAPIWGETVQPFLKIHSGSEKKYNSWNMELNGIKWRELNSDKVYHVKFLVRSINLGGNFEIKNSGNYSYHFNIDGSKKGRAQLETDRILELKKKIDLT